MIVFEKAKTAEQIVDLNCHQQMYSYEQLSSISCMGLYYHGASMRNVKVIQSSYILKANECRNALPSAAMLIL